MSSQDFRPGQTVAFWVTRANGDARKVYGEIWDKGPAFRRFRSWWVQGHDGRTILVTRAPHSIVVGAEDVSGNWNRVRGIRVREGELFHEDDERSQQARFVAERASRRSDVGRSSGEARA